MATKKRRFTTAGDRSLVPRISDYISEKTKGKDPNAPQVFFADDVVTYLQAKYPEYKRKPKLPFTKTVATILATIQKRAAYTIGSSDEDESSSSASSSDSDSPVEISPNHNLLNSSLQKKYISQQQRENIKADIINSIDGASYTPSASNSSVTLTAPPTTRFADLGGIDNTILQVKELIMLPFRRYGLYRHLGVQPPTGFLLYGPPGCGKTLLANAIAGELQLPFYKLSSTELISNLSGNSEKKIRDLFTEAFQTAPSIIFIDELDAITPKRDTSSKEMEKRIVSQFLSSIDALSTLCFQNNTQVLVLASTSRPDHIDPSLRRGGRFDKELMLGVPDEAGRAQILEKIILSKGLKISGKFNYTLIARNCPGYVGADIEALCREAAKTAIKRIFLSENKSIDDLLGSQETMTDEEMKENCWIEENDFFAATKDVQPSAKREGFATVPDTTFDDIGSLASTRRELNLSILSPIRHPELYSSVDLTTPSGILLFGPPGCGKTLLAKAIANEAGFNFISVKGPELLNKFVGESERGVRALFERAKNSAPCIVFFDELDALAPRRGGGSQVAETSGVSERVVNQLLTELDGMNDRRNVFVIGATNRPDIIDEAILRPGRLGRKILVPLPSAPERQEILQTITRKVKFDSDVDLRKIAFDDRCNGFSGADLENLRREACLAAVAEVLEKEEDHLNEEGVVEMEVEDQEKKIVVIVQAKHWEEAMDRVAASVSVSDAKRYDQMNRDFNDKVVLLSKKRKRSEKN